MHTETERNRLITIAKRFSEKQWMLGTSGNLSLKLQADPFEMLITASGPDKGQLQAEHILRVGLGAEVLETSAYKSSAETLLHEAIYKAFPSVSAVFHVHTLAATLLSTQQDTHSLTFSGLEMLKGLGQNTHECQVNVPILPNTQDIKSLANVLASQLLASTPGFILAGHGLYAWGESVEAATRHIEIFEFLFQLRLAELSLHAEVSIATGRACVRK
jgi:methylthioribulose-1-phosphate dehydratase